MTRTISALAPAALLLAVACDADAPLDAERYISPLDGQTGWALDTPLVVLAEDMDVPPEYPLPDLIRVVDLDDGGFVDGVTERFDDHLTFDPVGNWKVDRRYGWVVDMPEPVPHGPELTFPDVLEEAAVFDTRPRIDVLGGSVDPDRNVCVVMSRVLAADDGGTWRMTVGETELEDIVGSLVSRADWGPDLEFPEGDPGVDVLCFAFDGEDNPDPTEPPPVQAGDDVRLYWGSFGPWLVELADGPIVDEVQRLRRGVR